MCAETGVELKKCTFRLYVCACVCVCVCGGSPYLYKRELGKGNFGTTCLFHDAHRGDDVAIKFIARGPKNIDNNVMREVVVHQTLKHPNIVAFKEIRLTPTHLAIVRARAFVYVCV